MKGVELFDWGAAFGFVMIGALLACEARETAKTGYEYKSKACLEAYDDAPHRQACVDFVRAQYDEAGAPPAAKDGGHE
jgi:hypothetical protein